MPAVEVRRTKDMSEMDLILLWALVQEAFAGQLGHEDWNHALGGFHVIVSEGDQLISHAAVVGRTMLAGGRPLSVGYVEAVATRPKWQGQGHGTTTLRAVAGLIIADFEMGALATKNAGFYTRLGWERWKGATYVQAPTGRKRTAEDDDHVMILRTSRTFDLETTGPLVCEWRSGAVW